MLPLFPTALGMFLFGHLGGMAVLNGLIQQRAQLTLPEFSLVLSTGAVAALCVNLILRRLHLRVSGGIGLLLLAIAVWLPVTAQTLPTLLLAYALHGAASRLALSGLYRAIAAIQREANLQGSPGNPTLFLESIAGFGLGESFLLDSFLAHFTGLIWPPAMLCLILGVPTALWLHGRLPEWHAQPAAQAANTTAAAVPVAAAFVAYGAEVFTMTQASTWSSLLATSLTLGQRQIPPLLAAGLLSGAFWVMVGSVRYAASHWETLDLRRVVLLGHAISLAAAFGAFLRPNDAFVQLACYALLGAGISCFVPFALQTIARHPQGGRFADHFALLGQVMGVGAHLLTGNFAGQHQLFLLAALTLSLLFARK
jgi:hypothetical protein